MKMERERALFITFSQASAFTKILAQVTLEYMYVLTSTCSHEIWYLRHRSSYFNYRSLVKYYQEKIFFASSLFFHCMKLFLQLSTGTEYYFNLLCS